MARKRFNLKKAFNKAVNKIKKSDPNAAAKKAVIKAKKDAIKAAKTVARLQKNPSNVRWIDFDITGQGQRRKPLPVEGSGGYTPYPSPTPGPKKLVPPSNVIPEPEPQPQPQPDPIPEPISQYAIGGSGYHGDDSGDENVMPQLWSLPGKGRNTFVGWNDETNLSGGKWVTLENMFNFKSF